LAAFRQCRETLPHGHRVFLIVVGPLEPELDPLSADDLRFLNSDASIVLAGYQNDVRPWIMASDVFAFPSYREGFPNVVMQASCLEVPSIVSNINGCNEIVEHEKTGLIVSPKSAHELFQAMMRMASDPELRRTFARNARERVTKSFDRQFIWAELEKEYLRAMRLSLTKKSSVYRDLVKPFFDRSVALIALLVFSPVLLVCIGMLWNANNGKVWFRQYRPGRNGKLFRVLKFRTMTDERDASGTLLPDEDRLHGVGKFIRKTSLDELPQLLNVLAGDMSIVGPRPLLEEYLPLYSDIQGRRHDVKPGITGWAQVNGRNAISWEQKFTYDVWYVDNQSFLLDMKILLLTVQKVFKAEGISSATSATMEKFTGTRNAQSQITNTSEH
jgi:undecaprenyl phosphate N,N'-diacetylbacillosamine 1-phosphate transferase